MYDVGSIQELEWDEETEEYIWRHRVRPEEVEEAVYDGVLHVRRIGHRRLVLGQSAAGRYLLVVMRSIGKGRWQVVTALDMDDGERRLARR